MVEALPASMRSRIIRFLFRHWRPDAIAKEVGCSVTTVYEYQENLFMYGSISAPRRRRLGRPCKITIAAGDSLIEYLERYPWTYQKEMAWFLWEEHGIFVHQSTISRELKKRGWSGKKLQRYGRRNEELRQHWQASMNNVTAEQLVFIDETAFNETTGWRRMAYAPIGQPARYHGDINRGHNWSVLPAYTVDGYLPCTSIREGWFNADLFYQWVIDELLPYCTPYPGPRSVVAMDNASIHCNPRVEEAIRAHGCEIRYLPPYSPDYNPIELSFSVLKAWFRNHYASIRPEFEGTFGQLIRYAINRSHCDRFAKEHFRHSGGGYIFEADIIELERELLEGDVQIDFDEDSDNDEDEED